MLIETEQSNMCFQVCPVTYQQALISPSLDKIIDDVSGVKIFRTNVCLRATIRIQKKYIVESIDACVLVERRKNLLKLWQRFENLSSGLSIGATGSARGGSLMIVGKFKQTNKSFLVYGQTIRLN